jgi:ribosomal protein S1
MSEERSGAAPQSIADLAPKMELEGTVKRTTIHGAIVDIGVERDGLVHISQLAPSRVNRVEDVVQPGDKVTVWVQRVNEQNGTIALSMIEPPEVDWQELSEGQVRKGVVTRMESYGVFVDIGAERPGLLHVREMSSGYVRHPSEIVQMGQEVEVRILKYDRRRRRIDLSMMGIAPEMADPEDDEEGDPLPTSMEIALQRAREQREEPRGTLRRQASRPSKKISDELAEREAILERTLRQHSKS